MGKGPPRPQIYSGLHAVDAILRHRPQDVLELWVLDERAGRGEARLSALVGRAGEIGVSVQHAGRTALERKAGPQHQGVVARARPRRPGHEQALTSHLGGCSAPLVLALDGVTDPHNLGACLRCADAAGVEAVVVPERHSAGLTAVACRSAAGAAESVAFFQVTNLARTLAGLREQGLQTIGATGADQALSLRALEPAPGGQVVVMGAEGAGLRPVTRKQCDQEVAIPMRGEVESLNVSVATALVLYQLAVPA
jgi:23S rRNA (guanosine2251-2'-O)-methyltransferase